MHDGIGHMVHPPPPEMESPPWMETPWDGEAPQMETPRDGEPPQMENHPPGWRTPPDGEPPWMENPPDGEPPDGEPPQMENPPRTQEIYNLTTHTHFNTFQTLFSILT